MNDHSAGPLPATPVADAARFARSEALRWRAHAMIPGGAHTYAKGDDQYPVLAPGFIRRGAGCRVWDVDGNEYVEYGMGNRAVGLGHCHPEVLAAARVALEFGCNFTRPSPLEAECAEMFLDSVPGAEMVKFCKDGSDATSGAVRLARAYTGRDMVAICSDHPFFSTDDWFIGTTPMTAGIPLAVRELTTGFRYGDLADAQAMFDRHPGRIAALILEPSRGEDPPPGYLAALRDMAHREGALFVLDEMITGFRWSRGGAQEVYGVVPDLATFGKALGNGFSVSALCGLREIMRLGGIEHRDRPRVFLLSTTHGAETHALAAATETMRIYRDEPVTARMHETGAALRRELEDVIAAHGLEDAVRIVGRDCCLAYQSLDGSGQPSQAFRSLLLQETIRRGVLAPSLVVSYAHGAEDIAATVAAFDGALGVYRKALDEGVGRYLVGRPSQVVFRSHNTAPADLP
ncbi:glutamate-1-semialdehyde 2,1-aminomutase [Oceaniglobus roseus]|uniref:glutamate-1-semialdehyde 2,1-aminomutase n=1 Tax=Oceaniglobus roseus TaxID=1737570 RepID=UPI000C7EE8CC|nr:glutamate-1-semialdehyde 2,1-aminomutase [Kandeliimicrobium roseum]